MPRYLVEVWRTDDPELSFSAKTDEEAQALFQKNFVENPKFHRSSLRLLRVNVPGRFLPLKEKIV